MRTQARLQRPAQGQSGGQSSNFLRIRDTKDRTPVELEKARLYEGFQGIKRTHFGGFGSAPLVSRSADYYFTRPLIPRCRRRWRIVVIVKSARLRGHEIPCLAALSRRQH